MKKYTKPLSVILYALTALPIPLSLATWIGTIMAFASIGMSPITSIADIAGAVFMLAFFVFAGLYPLTYAYSLYLTVKRRCIGVYSFLPILHIAVFAKMWMDINILSLITHF